MKKRLSLAVTTALTAGALSFSALIAPVATAAESLFGTPEAEQPVTIGHRGAAGTAPENTVAAFKDGRAAGADFIESDVQLSADGVPFLFHDDTPARTTNVEEVFPGRENDPITSFTWAELQQLDAGSYFSEKFIGEKIPHFNDIARVATKNTGVFMEIKSPKNSPGVEKVVADALHNDPAWIKLVEAGKVEILSFDPTSNMKFAALAPEIPLQQLSSTVPDAATLALISTFADSVGTSYRTLDQAGVDRVKAAGLEIGVYTVNDIDAMEEAVAMGVERITGDYPIQFERYLDGVNPFPASRGLVITDSVNDAPGNDVQAENGEHVVVTNTGNAAVDVSGYYLRDVANNLLHIGEGYVIEPGASLQVFTGPGTNTADKFYNGKTSAILNNGGEALGFWTANHTLLDSFAN
ncbi:glycerophosphoryl diester phosphodiesterase [Neomicrococcus aestuarii]|uniref:Glycerophosphoryl diester phosphodiesterase n=1 Tax=Neomicrococcus aestuarii TaxID=556325 RepID=A0A7W8TW21_9MICC|nr:glycerophosphodiester phosphodiesterase family protein [Neomicrococcus aestuarii]MBB5513160.1 glycerophosphoryl diester phosphodiesterase [Neomicrococcus aestuarii]